MRQQSIKCLFLVGLSAFMLTGCEKEIPASQETDASAIVVVEAEVAETESESESAPDLVVESVDANQVTEKVPDLRETYTSSFGYSMKYDKAVFEYNQHGGYDEFVMKTKAFSSDPLVFFAAMRIESDELKNVKTDVFGQNAVPGKVGTRPYDALTLATQETLEKGKYTQHHETFLVDLTGGDGLLFEIQWFESAESDATAGDQLQQMLASLEIDQAAGSTVTETEQETETKAETASETETAD